MSDLGLSFFSFGGKERNQAAASLACEPTLPIPGLLVPQQHLSQHNALMGLFYTSWHNPVSCEPLHRASPSSLCSQSCRSGLCSLHGDLCHAKWKSPTCLGRSAAHAVSDPASQRAFPAPSLSFHLLIGNLGRLGCDIVPDPEH